MCWMCRPAVGVQFNASDLFMLKMSLSTWFVLQSNPSDVSSDYEEKLEQ